MIELVFDTRVMEQGAASRDRRRVVAMRAVGFADDDSVPARDLSTGERMAPSAAGDQTDVGPEGARAEGASGDRLTLVGRGFGAWGDRSSGRPEPGARGGPVDLVDAARRVAPLTLARTRRLDVTATMSPMLPDGLQRGTTVGVRGPAALSLALAAAAGPMVAGSWLAVVGCGDLCPAGAEALGVVLHRTVVVDEPPHGSWGSVLAALFDAFDIVIVDRVPAPGVRSGTTPIAHRDVGRLGTRARERGTVIIDVGDVWPAAPDLCLDVVAQQWSGLGDGHGLLDGRDLTIEVSGRRGAGRPRRVDLSLPAATTLAAHAGADIDAIVDADLSGTAPPAGDEGAAVRSPRLRRVG